MFFYSWLTAGEEWLILKQFHCKCKLTTALGWGRVLSPQGRFPGDSPGLSRVSFSVSKGHLLSEGRKTCIYCCFLRVSPLAAAAQDGVKHFLHRYSPALTKCLGQIRWQTPSEFNFPCCCFGRGKQPNGFVWFEVSSSVRCNCFESAKKTSLYL